MTVESARPATSPLDAPSAAAPPPITGMSVGLRSARGPILASLMLATSLVALDSTIIATAVPSVVADLGGFAQFPWLFSVYLLAQAVSVPIYGKLSDLFGRKPVMMTGIGLFLLGSALAGTAWSMTALIIFRAVQGLGAGAVQPMSLTIAGDIYTVAERAKVQGYLASVWGISAVVGPTLGGLFSEYLSWRWIFLVNIPLCLLAAWMLRARLHENVARQHHDVDYLGAALLTSGCSLLILGLLEGGQAWPWSSPTGVVVLVMGGLLTAGFVVVQRRVAEPVLPLWVFRRRILVASSVGTLAVGAITLGLSSYVPTYAQTTLGAGPLAAGFALAALTVGWPLAASQAGRLYLRFGFRITALVGATVTVLGSAGLLLLGGTSPLWEVAAYCFVTGIGLGWVASPTLIAAQASVGWADRGVVTGLNMFSRSIGSAIGIAVFGAIANAILAGTRSPALVEVAAHRVFLSVAVVAAAMFLACLALPGRARPCPDDHAVVAGGSSRPAVATPDTPGFPA